MIKIFTDSTDLTFFTVFLTGCGCNIRKKSQIRLNSKFNFKKSKKIPEILDF
jgi:hypothetical protein